MGLRILFFDRLKRHLRFCDTVGCFVFHVSNLKDNAYPTSQKGEVLVLKMKTFYETHPP